MNRRLGNIEIRKVEKDEQQIHEIICWRKNIECNYCYTIAVIDLDEDVEKADEIGYTGEEHKPGVVPNKSLEIAEVSKLKSIVKNYYEEIEYLRAELDKLRARTFPSFLQKPDNVIYPDEK